MPCNSAHCTLSFANCRYLVFIDDFFLFFFNDTATTEIYTLSLHDALPISPIAALSDGEIFRRTARRYGFLDLRSEEHTSELQSLRHLVCRLLLEKKKKKNEHGLSHKNEL